MQNYENFLKLQYIYIYNKVKKDYKMDKNENCLFDIMYKFAMILCLVAINISMVRLNHKMNTYIEEYEHQFNVYQKLVKEYHETPSMYNKMTTYDKIKVFEDSLH